MSSQMASQALPRIALNAAAAGMVAGATNLVAAGAIFGGTTTYGFQMIASGLTVMFGVPIAGIVRVLARNN